MSHWPTPANKPRHSLLRTGKGTKDARPKKMTFFFPDKLLEQVMHTTAHAHQRMHRAQEGMCACTEQHPHPPAPQSERANDMRTNSPQTLAAPSCMFREAENCRDKKTGMFFFFPKGVVKIVIVVKYHTLAFKSWRKKMRTQFFCFFFFFNLHK